MNRVTVQTKNNTFLSFLDPFQSQEFEQEEVYQRQLQSFQFSIEIPTLHSKTLTPSRCYIDIDILIT